MTDAGVQILLKARNETQKVLKQAQSDLKKYDAQAKAASDTTRRQFTLSVGLARAALAGFAATATLVAAQVWRLERSFEQGGASIAAMAGMTKEGAAVIRNEIRTLFGENSASVDVITDAVDQVNTTFKIFDVRNPQGLAQLLVDWNAATKQNLGQAGQAFRRIILAYYGPEADAFAALDETSDKIFTVAAALGIDPGGLAHAMSESAYELKTAFPTFDEALTFLASIGAAGGDIRGAGRAIQTFIKQVNTARESIAKGDFEHASLDAFRALGLTPETIANEGFTIGELMMMALKNGMADGVLTPEELEALGILFSSEVAGDMAAAGSAIEGFVAAADAALLEYEGSVERAASVTDGTLGSRIAQAWNELWAAIGGSAAWRDAESRVAAGLDLLRSIVEWFDSVRNFDFEGMVDSGFDMGIAMLRILGLGDQADAAIALRNWWENEAIPAFQAWYASLDEDDLFVAFTQGRFFAALLERAIGTAATVRDGIRDWFDGTFRPQFQAYIDGHPLIQGGISLYRGFIDAATAAINDGSTGIIPWAVNRWRTFEEAFTAWTNNVVGTGREMWDSFILGLGQTWADVTGWVGRKWTDLQAEFDVWITNAQAVGGDLMDGLAEGMTRGMLRVSGLTGEQAQEVIDNWKRVLGIQSPSKVFMEIGAQVMDGFRSGLDDGARANLDSARAFLGDLRDIYTRNAEALKGLFDGTYKPMWSDMLTDGLSALEQLGIGVSDATKGMLGAWAGYADQFMGLLDKHNGNVLRAFADLLLGVAQQKLLELAVVSAVEIGKAWIEAPATFGASLAKLGPITAAYAAGAAAIAALRSQIVGSLAIGSEYVPTEGIYKLHEGEAVLTRTEAQAYRSGYGGGSQPIIIENTIVMDGKVITDVVSRRLYGGVRQHVKADLRYSG